MMAEETNPLEVMQQTLAKVVERQTQIEKYLSDGLAEQVKKTVTDTLTPIVEAIQKKFDEHEGFMKQLAQTKGGGGGGVMDFLGKIIDKIPVQGSTGGMNEMDKLILTETKQIQAISLKSVLNKVAKEAGVVVPSEVEHMVLATK